MRRALLRAALLGAVVVAVQAGPASARVPVIGIGDQTPVMFTSPFWRALDVRHARVIASWDALRHKWSRDDLDTYMYMAQAAGVDVLLGFGHARDDKRHHKAPTVRAFRKEFLKFRARYPWVREFLAWNEANHCGEPTCRKPGLAAAYYNMIRANCEGCKVVAVAVLDGTEMPAWIRAFRRRVRGPKRKIIWGVHNYIDANRFRSRGTRSLLRATRSGPVWFTETGGLIVRRNNSKIKFPGNRKHAAKAVKQVFRLARLSKRVRRIYFYNWSPSTVKLPTWDSALTDLRGKPRPAYKVLKAWLRRHR